MNKQFVLFMLLTSLVSYSCRKDKFGEEGKPYITNPTSYVLKRQTWTGPTSNGSSLLYFYNSQHLVSRIERHQWGTYAVSGGPSQKWYDTGYYNFQYTYGLCSKLSISEGGAKGYLLYEYNKKNLLVKRTNYRSDNTIQSYSFYQYDNTGNMIEKTDSSNKVDFRYVFTYNGSNNLTSITGDILWSNPKQKMKYEWLAFDNSINFIKAVNGLPPSFFWDNNYHSYSSSSPNNFLAVNYYPPVNQDQSFGTPSFSNYSYDLNDEGLPTKMMYGPWLVSFEYEKYK